ncbi:PGPGW domain-containing protein [Streptomyces sp. NBC_00223]|uniref:PGPGW domain-containing protein n=1 Tax=Streptomyces sp. NBC_00223 TaxID=2976008 RepID=UPI00324AA1DB
MNGARRAKTGAPDAESAQGATEAPPVRLHPAKRLVLGIAGGVLTLIGTALLVLPGPGLLLVLAGLIMLSRAVPPLARFVAPVRNQAMVAAEASVTSAWRIAGSVLAGLALVAAGIVWGVPLVSQLPFTGWSTGSSLILSGVVLFTLLVWSYRRVHGSRRVHSSRPPS